MQILNKKEKMKTKQDINTHKHKRNIKNATRFQCGALCGREI